MKFDDDNSCRKVPSHHPILVLGHALLFAAAILVAAWWSRGSDQSQTVTFLIIALWFGSSAMLFSSPKKVACELGWAKRKIARMISTRKK